VFGGNWRQGCARAGHDVYDIGQIRVVDNADHILNMRVEIDLTAEEVLAKVPFAPKVPRHRQDVRRRGADHRDLALVQRQSSAAARRLVKGRPRAPFSSPMLRTRS
jgi:hypothetical protein